MEATMASTLDAPFRKRPRLSMFSPTEELDEDLGSRRMRNDALLKSRFESIFAKYSRDFSDVGDEIDTHTLSVVVDKGHLQNMENETDPGGLQDQTGQRLLRAMTVLPDTEPNDYEIEDADRVMDSIEEIAQNAAAAEAEDDEDNEDAGNAGDSDQDRIVVLSDSDDELFLPVNAARGSHSTPSASWQGDLPSAAPSRTWVNQPVDRDSSPDSLFEVPNPGRQMARPLSEVKTAEDEAILKQFGPQIGPEIVAIVQKARKEAAQAHIEPAWRLPNDLVPLDEAQASSTASSNTPPAARFVDMVPVSPEAIRSLWKPARHRRTKREVQQARAQEQLRAESEDPLQEDFQDVSSAPVIQPDPPEKAYHIPNPADKQLILMAQGKCFYCHRERKTRGSIHYHWVQLDEAHKKGILDPEDVHDMVYIHEYVKDKYNPVRSARVTVADFKVMVELHEGAGLSFDQIAARRVCMTHKSGDALNDIYDKYRSAEHDVASYSSPDWTKDELDLLSKLTRNSTRGMANFAKHLQGRSSIECGDKLAELWLVELAESQNPTNVPDPIQRWDHRPMPTAVSRRAVTASLTKSTPGSITFQSPARGPRAPDAPAGLEPSLSEVGPSSHAYTPTIKEEVDSDDELFGRAQSTAVPERMPSIVMRASPPISPT